MNTDSIKSNLTTSFVVFVNDLGDVTGSKKEELENKSGYKINELFKKQRNSDLAKKKLGGRDFNTALAFYFNRFLTKDGVDAEMLHSELEKYSQALKHHLKKDAFRFLKLIAQVGVACQDGKKGLL